MFHASSQARPGVGIAGIGNSVNRLHDRLSGIAVLHPDAGNNTGIVRGKANVVIGWQAVNELGNAVLSQPLPIITVHAVTGVQQKYNCFGCAGRQISGSGLRLYACHQHEAGQNERV